MRYVDLVLKFHGENKSDMGYSVLHVLFPFKYFFLLNVVFNLLLKS